ncbi:MAG: RNA recognition motif domain-containing protein, partial [Candidatus Methylomirabilia bacterium]
PTDRETGRPRGFAFVEFSTEAEAAEAIRLFNGREVDGRKLTVNAAEDRPSRTDRFGSDRPRGPSFAPDPFGGGGAPPRKDRFRSKGSRRGLRARKRSL